MNLSRPSVRRTGLVLLVALLAVGSTACSGRGPVGASSAAEVNGGTISSDEVFTLLDAAGRTEGSSAQQSAVKGAGMNDTFKMTGFTEILGGLIRQQVIDDALDDRGVEVTDANRKAARQEIDAQLKQQSQQQSGKVDPVLVDWAVDTRASQLALTEAVSDTDPAEREKALRDAYDQLKGDYAQVCLSAVSSTSEADARAVKARLDDGDDIATVAKEESTESQSAANEGNIGCGTVTQAAQFVGSSLTADAENGDIIGPAQTNAVEGQSWIVARVDSIQVQTFDQLRAQLEQTVPDADQSALQRAMAVLMRRADVTVTSKYGTWDREGRHGGSAGRRDRHHGTAHQRSGRAARAGRRRLTASRGRTHHRRRPGSG